MRFGVGIFAAARAVGAGVSTKIPPEGNMTTSTPEPLPGQPKVDAQVQAADAAAQKNQTDAGQVPATSASKSDWVDYAVSQGMTREDAESSTKDALSSKYGA